MTVDTGTSKILAKLQGRSKGAYDKAKEVEAQASGRTLPAGLEGAIAQMTDAKLGESEGKGDPYFFIYSSVVEPDEQAGIFNGLIYMLCEDDYNTYDDNLGRLIGDLKLMGFSGIIETAANEGEMLVNVIKHIKAEKPFLVFNTSKRPNKRGEYRAFVQGAPDEDYAAPTPDDAKSQAKAAKSKAATKPSANGVGPGKAKKKAASTPTSVNVGDAVATIGNYFEDNEVYTGTVTSIDKKAKTAMVEFDDGTGESEVPWDNLKVTGSPVAASSGDIEVDDRVQTLNDHFDDGEVYQGTVTNVGSESATVVFDDDGSEQEVPLSNLEPVT